MKVGGPTIAASRVIVSLYLSLSFPRSDLVLVVSNNVLEISSSLLRSPIFLQPFVRPEFLMFRFFQQRMTMLESCF